MIKVCLYKKKYKNLWNDHIASSKNGSFLFCRDFMDYHSDRFIDCSFIVWSGDVIIAVLPGNIAGNIFYSHQGLTFGGLISSRNITMRNVLTAFDLINDHLRQFGVNEVFYKPSPYIYHTLPAQEDIYYLFKKGAEKIGCAISSVIYQNERLRFSDLRRRGVKKSTNNNVSISEETDFKGFWDILSNNLYKKYKTFPVHTLDEITYLKSKFKNNIRLFLAKYNSLIAAGVVVFKSGNVSHVQYIASTEQGRAISALDLLFDKLINEYFVSIPVFDFGHSTEDMGEYLNENLIFQKEGFGARGVVYEAYRYMIMAIFFFIKSIEFCPA